MANLSDRIQNLTPEQQELLRRRMQVRNSQNASPAADLPKRERSSNTLRSSSEPVKVDFSLFFLKIRAGGPMRYSYVLAVCF